MGTRRATGGAAPAAVESMIRNCERDASDLHDAVTRRREVVDRAEARLLDRARRTAEQWGDSRG